MLATHTSFDIHKLPPSVLLAAILMCDSICPTVKSKVFLCRQVSLCKSSEKEGRLPVKECPFLFSLLVFFIALFDILNEEHLQTFILTLLHHHKAKINVFSTLLSLISELANSVKLNS